MCKKVGLPMLPKSFGKDKIVRTYGTFTPLCKLGYNYAFQAPARFGGRSHSQQDFERENSTTKY